tara:strand:- start:473 stop:814 length:342 start_codon:yes stop_codon:yes gene_type:complete
MIDKSDAINELIDGKYSIQADGSVVYHSGQTPPSEEAIQAKIAELQASEPMRVLREERNRKLAQTDWRASSDLKLSSEWTTYRQALRDLPSTAKPSLDDNGNLQNVTWPKEPT